MKSSKSDTSYKNYIHDLGCIIKDLTLEAKINVQNEKDRNYAIGRLMAFHEIIDLMQLQANSFNIPLKELGLDNFNPDKDLL